MKRIQCTGCGQVFWTELQLDEALLSSGEWIRNPCPKCRAEWSVFEPEAGVSRTRGRKAKPGAKRPGRPRKTVQVKGEATPAKQKAEGTGFSPAAIRRLRKKLGVTQAQFASLVGASIGTIVGWESGKFKPRANKVAELSDVDKWDKDQVRTTLAKQQPKRAEVGPAKTRVQKGAKPKARKRERRVEGKPSEARSKQKSPEPERTEEAKSPETPQSQEVQGAETAKTRKKRGGTRKAMQGRTQLDAS